MSLTEGKYSKAPVSETVLGIQFGELARFTTVHFGLFYAHLKGEFEVAEDHPRLAPIIETFPPRVKQPGFRLVDVVAPGRLWLRDRPDGNVLLQLQPDRLTYNWRKSSAGDEYPRYPQRLSRCLEMWNRFLEFCQEYDLGTPKVDICEVVYVNQIFPAEKESVAAVAAQTLAGIDRDYWEDDEPESFSLNRTYPTNQELRRGREYVEIGNALHNARGPFLSLKLTARCFHNEAETLQQTLDFAHQLVIARFESSTSDYARNTLWR